ncbi:MULTISPECIES: ribose-phosphate pyrophosphokinase [unclassified Fusibacter]|uniref:ribose-phosphate pyrophosphokinase n=1 Tax=unclassified Fusibacter TaxID=2624464 RepID=UPI00101398BB|nr:MULTISPECIES: ribose-phosphate pyrophosphokinase [unclassified Fusibacter]MCK8060450.1 ribose-phosphate pyrophosphokinase [Fusibacter sp. A2]NPE20261.1 ribose-phosphate pyrophosphokinase [Fusibacter sp. A1]RXV63468.1 ribose-phosphate pyrophosphokinase [Fusibacter sp. A1]
MYYQPEREPNGKLGIIALESCKEIGETIDYFLTSKRNYDIKELGSNHAMQESYLIDIKEVRFSNGEGKVVIEESVRGRDIFILCDVGNYSCTYEMYGFTNRKGPDEHFQDIKRVVSALNGRAKRVTVMMPLLYESRQHRRKYRESLDCAQAMQELETLGVHSIITFDVHDPNVQNAIPLVAFNNMYPTFNIVKKMFEVDRNLILDNKNLIIISPDTGAMDRSIYYASVLGVDVGMFYKRRDYSKVVGGKNPIVEHEYMGRDVDGMDVLIVDDMIASGESVFDIANELKKRNAKRIYVATTFALFTEGVEKFEKYHKEGVIEKVFSTNLTYIPPKALSADWFEPVDMSGFIADIMDHVNMDESIEPIIDDAGNIKRFLRQVEQLEE